MRNFILVKSGLHMVLAFDRVLKRFFFLKLSTYRLQIFLVKYEYLRSLELCEYQGVRGKLKKPCKHVLQIHTTYMEIRL